MKQLIYWYILTTTAFCCVYCYNFNRSTTTYDLLQNVDAWNKRRYNHPACACRRNMEYNYTSSNTACSRQLIHNIPIWHFIEGLKNHVFLFLGDSVINQENCNLNCLLSDYYINKTTDTITDTLKVDKYHYYFNITIIFLQVGGWGHENNVNCAMNEAAFVIEMASTIYFNIGNHFTNSTHLNCSLIHYGELFQKANKTKEVLFRLQTPPHFHTQDGHLDTKAIENNGKLEPSTSCYNGQNHLINFRYLLGLEFVAKNNYSVLDVTKVSNNACLHPRYHDKKPVHDCLHYPQDGTILTDINVLMLHMIVAKSGRKNISKSVKEDEKYKLV